MSMTHHSFLGQLSTATTVRLLLAISSESRHTAISSVCILLTCTLALAGETMEWTKCRLQIRTHIAMNFALMTTRLLSLRRRACSCRFSSGGCPSNTSVMSNL